MKMREIEREGMKACVYRCVLYVDELIGHEIEVEDQSYYKLHNLQS